MAPVRVCEAGAGGHSCDSGTSVSVECTPFTPIEMRNIDALEHILSKYIINNSSDFKLIRSTIMNFLRLVELEVVIVELD